MAGGGKTPRRKATSRHQNISTLCQSTINNVHPSSRLLVWHSCFSHVASRHQSVVNGLALNQQVELFLPSQAGKTLAQSLQWESGFYYEVKASINMFLSPAFIREYLTNGGTVFMLSKNVAVDMSQSAMLLPSGHLLLLVDMNTYQQLGIIGEKYGKAIPPTCRTGKTQKYVISLDLTSKMFTQEGDNAARDRIRTSLSSKLENFEMLLCAYNARGSPRTILFEEDDAVSRSRVELNSTTKTFNDIFLPQVDAFYQELNAQGDKQMDVLRTSLQEVYDWLGLVACRLTDLLQRKKIEEYVSTFTGTSTLIECQPESEITTLRWRGLIAAPFCSNLVEKVHAAVKNHELPWAAVTVWGFPDTFVSWIQQTKSTNEFQRREHGYLANGNNNYTVLMLPNDEYFILQELGPHDATM